MRDNVNSVQKKVPIDLYGILKGGFKKRYNNSIFAVNI